MESKPTNIKIIDNNEFNEIHIMVDDKGKYYEHIWLAVNNEETGDVHVVVHDIHNSEDEFIFEIYTRSQYDKAWDRLLHLSNMGEFVYFDKLHPFDL